VASSNDPKPWRAKFTPADIISTLGNEPTCHEIERLVTYYPTYKLKHRQILLEAIITGRSHEWVTAAKITVKKTFMFADSKQAKGGHARWASAKLRRTTLRLLYLHYRLDLGLSRRQANARIVQAQPASDARNLELLQSNIRKATHSPVLDRSGPKDVTDASHASDA